MAAMSKRRRTSLWRLLPFVGVAIPITAVTFLMLFRDVHIADPARLKITMSLAPNASSAQDRPIEVTMLAPRAPSFVPLPPLVDAEQQKKIDEAKKPEEDPQAKGQVVDTAQPQVEIRPDEAKFLSEHDIKVEKQTRGKPGDGQAGARIEHHATNPTPQPPPPSTTGRRGSDNPGPLAMRTQAERRPAGSREGLAPAPDGTERPRGEAAERAPTTEGGGPPAEGNGGDEQTPQRSTDLHPSDQDVTKALGAGSQDYLPDVDEGEETLVNTKRWKYATFFNRVKRAVAHSWRPESAYRLRDPTGQIYGLKNRMTVLKVSLKPDGSLRDVLLERPSGVDFLDDEAISAFKEAQPFPNPPLGLIDKESNLITFRFGFYFEISGSPVFKVYRY
jgi:TonB family protein